MSSKSTQRDTPRADAIVVSGAREHNLRDVDVELPRDAMTVITGVSGSGKSSLAFDTVYQEGQRRFLESLSSYARQFLGSMEKPQVDRVEGLSPTLCIDQKTVNRNPRSTVGTVTEILDHLRLLFARLGTPRCPVCERAIESLSPGQIADAVLRDHPGARLHVLAPIVQDRKGEYRKELAEALRDGFLRARIDGELHSLEEPPALARYEKHTIELVVDRLKARPDSRPRLVEAVERALRLSGELVSFLVDVPRARRTQGEPGEEAAPPAEPQHRLFSSQRTCPDHGISIPEMEPRLFSFNAPQGMCEGCSGIGYLEDFDLELLIDPDARYDQALRPLQEDERLPFSTLSRDAVRQVGKQLGIASVKTCWKDLPDEAFEALLFGRKDLSYRYEKTTTDESSGRSRTRKGERGWSGFLPIVQHVWHFTHLKRLAQYRRRQVCPQCRGARLNAVARAVDFRGKHVHELTTLSIEDLQAFFSGVRLGGSEVLVGGPVVKEIQTRLRFLVQVGLGYLSLDRSARTLSGGESQRIRLAGQVGASLQGVTYVLDEPSIGLHARDHDRLLDALVKLKGKGNTVIVVEHDPATMARADYLVEIGPGAGREGGQLVAAGSPRRFLRSKSTTARYLRGELRIPLPSERRPGSGEHIEILGCTGNNLQDVDLRVPLGTFTVVSGVSGSGKSTLIAETLYPLLARALHRAEAEPQPHREVRGLEHVDKVIEIDQQPIGRTPRSNPATYTGAFTEIRKLFTQLPEARARGYKPGRFSFNVKGGRCEECEGAGVKTVEMQFLADVQVPCEACGGRRFNPETLEIRYRGRSISDVLAMTIREAAAFFQRHRKLKRILGTLERVGLGYVALGQPSTTLSGGEAQRVKLATELQRPATGRTLYILDEPTTGLHIQDVGRLLEALQELVDAGNTVLVIEHNTDVLKVADHVVDLGPEGGVGGGRIVGAGTPEQVAELDTPTGRVLAATLDWEQEAEDRANGEAAVAEPLPAYGFDPVRPRRAKRDVRISLRGVQTHNLQGVDLDLPRGQLTVITGPSGSGKTSLAFDTLFAEGQRRYVESLSTYARRFLGRLDRARLESAEGLAPAIAIDQRNRGHSPRSTVATATEIQDGLRLLYARIGQPHCPRCLRRLQARSPSAAARHLAARDPGAGWLLARLAPDTRAVDLRADGYLRAWLPGDSGLLSAGRELDLESVEGDAALPEGAWLVLDRLNPAKVARERLAEAISAAYGWGGDRAVFVSRSGRKELVLTRRAECPVHGPVLPEELTPRHFSFNSHVGACEACTGLGKRLEVDPDLLLTDRALPLDEALEPKVAGALFRSARTRALVDAVFARFEVPRQAPVAEWPRALHRALLYGLGDEELPITFTRSWGRSKSVYEERRPWAGVVAIVEGWSRGAEALRRETVCSACEGGRLRPEVLAVTIGGDPAFTGPAEAPEGVAIHQATAMTVTQARAWWQALELGTEHALIAEQVVRELVARLGFLEDVGLGYLTLDRAADSLSGGEAQRIRLATQLGARLTGTIYVLDEPTIGLHPRDTERLMGTLEGLRDLGNTLVVVEHDPEVMLRADHLVDMGPGAGEHGGRIVAQGSPEALLSQGGLTAAYLSGRKRVQQRTDRRAPRAWLTAPPSTVHNLRGVAPRVPLGCLTVVTGVSGSGKSTLVMEALAPWVEHKLRARQALEVEWPPGPAANRDEAVIPERVVVVDQQPIGRSPRSTPATFTKVLDDLRSLYAQVPLARERGWTRSRFSYNTPDGGRCPHCEGRGAVHVEMHFLSDVWVTCEHCGGRRFGPETLEVRWKGLSIADVLDMPVEDALPSFHNQRRIRRKLQALVDVGLGYVRLGQPGTTLSGGEAQRLKLANELKAKGKRTLFILDEPTTGLHFGDVDKLLTVLHRLVDQGHTAVVIEHQLDVIRNADHLVDMGPEGGEGGGRIVASGTPEEVATCEESWTGRALREARHALERASEPAAR